MERTSTKATLMRKPHVTATITINVPLNITVPIVSKTPGKENTQELPSYLDQKVQGHFTVEDAEAGLGRG